MLEAPPKDSDEIIEEMTRKMMMRLPKHPDMLSPEEREQLDPKEKERLAEFEINRIIEQEIRASFEKIGLDYNDSKSEMPISMKTAFSKTAREYYIAQQTSSIEQCETSDDTEPPTSRTISETTEPATEQAENNEHKGDATLNVTEMVEETKQIQDQLEKEPAPFAHLSRKEYLKRIGIIN
jgi:hypothetical protein